MTQLGHRAQPSFIELDRVSKRFGGVTALDQVTFGIDRAEVHAVVGENGAGKSTLMKLLAGIYPPDNGEIRIAGQTVTLKNPKDARRQGISIVFQELNLFPHRSVTANLFANRELTRAWGCLNRPAMRDATSRVLSELGVGLPPDALVERLSLAEKQLVEIARALDQRPRIIILDEPNSALNEAESRRLFEVIRHLRAAGITVLYVSHRLEEVFAIADRITVLRDGRYQGTWPTGATTIPRIIAAMIGRPLDHSFPESALEAAPGPVMLEVRDLCHGSRLGPISFTARAGEIVGFAGLEGAGIDELFHLLFGLEPVTAGEIVLHGKPDVSRSPGAAIRRGWALIPKSRREEGLMMNWSIARNVTLLVVMKLLNRLGLVDQAAVRRTTDHSISRFRIAAPGLDQPVASLSGGNQQKVLLAKWLATTPAILLLNDPTRGVDVAAKREIYELCRELARQGLTILMTSSEAEEILGLADRVVVLSQGKLVREFHRGAATKAELIQAMTAPPLVDISETPP